MAIRCSTDSRLFATEKSLWSTREATERPLRSATKATERSLSLPTERPVCQTVQCGRKLNKAATSEASVYQIAKCLCKQKSSCDKLVDDNLLYRRSVRTRCKDVNYRKKREREPSRINIPQILKILKKKRARKTVQSAFRHCFPNTSFVRKICSNCMTLMIFYKKVHFYSKFVSFLRTKKQTVVQSSSIFLSELGLKGGMLPQNSVECFHEAPWNNLVQKLELIGLEPLDVGGLGACFFKSVAHQLYRTTDLHYDIRTAGISHMNSHPELYIESIANTSFENYINEMSRPDTWCDHIIMQAVANALCCVMHITDCNIASAEATVITPVCSQGKPKVIFLGYINGLHYVSTVEKCRNNKNSLRNLKSKLTMDKEKKQKKLVYYSVYQNRKAAQETKEEKQTRQKRLRECAKKKRSEETKQEKQSRQKKLRQHAKKKRSQECKQEKQKRQQKLQECAKKKRSQESKQEKQKRQQRSRECAKKRRSQESKQEKQNRQQKLRECAKKRRSQESKQEKQNRQQRLQECAKKR